ncbi:MAG: SH3 domain-containing protein [Pseudomonadota bacterium]|nr:SH3 domain-containing protein [Pseudomonadota bacterium]
MAIRPLRFNAMAIPVLLALLAGAAVPALAQDSGIYRVSGVAADDRLNIRAEPRSDAPVVGSFAPGAGRIDVLEVRANAGAPWGRVIAGEANGWVAMRFLAPDTAEPIEGTGVPVALTCGGTEPFWSLTFSQSRLRLSSPAEGDQVFDLAARTTAEGRYNRFALVATRADRRLTAVLARGPACSDGMSDRDYGWRIDLVDEAGELRLFEGCCHLPPVE